jgi:hypothetical protein
MDVYRDRYYLVDADTLQPETFWHAFGFTQLWGVIFWLFPLSTPVPFGLWDKYQRSPFEKACNVVYIMRDDVPTAGMQGYEFVLHCARCQCVPTLQLKLGALAGIASSRRRA